MLTGTNTTQPRMLTPTTEAGIIEAATPGMFPVLRCVPPNGLYELNIATKCPVASARAMPMLGVSLLPVWWLVLRWLPVRVVLACLAGRSPFPWTLPALD